MSKSPDPTFRYLPISCVLGSTKEIPSAAKRYLHKPVEAIDTIILNDEDRNSDSLLDVLDLTTFAQPGDETLPKDPEQKSIADDLLQNYIDLGIIQQGKETKESAVPGPSPLVQKPRLSAVPWLHKIKPIATPSLRLHQEIIEFCKYLQPSRSEEQIRKDAIARIQQVIQAIWPSASLQIFGSFAAGLYLPTSDIDAVILDSGCDDIPSGLKALAKSLLRKGMAKNLQVISKARVPIIKFEEQPSGYNFDISFDVANGPEAAANVRDLMKRLPSMKPLVLVLKVFLHQRQLNEVYSGGLGSYALLVMVASFLQMHPTRGTGDDDGHKYRDDDYYSADRRYNRKRKRYDSSDDEEQYTLSRKHGNNSTAKNNNKKKHSDTLESNLGILLLDFLRLYSRTLFHTFVGVSCRRGGMYYNKRSRGFFNEERPYLLSVEDPNDVTNDLGKNSYNISRVRIAFDFAYSKLTEPVGEGESMLKKILRLDRCLFHRDMGGGPGGQSTSIGRQEGGQGATGDKSNNDGAENKREGTDTEREKSVGKKKKRKRR